MNENQLGTQFDPIHARNDPAYAAAYGSGPLSSLLASPTSPTNAPADISMYIEYYKKYYESMGYTFPPDFDFHGYLAGMLNNPSS